MPVASPDQYLEMLDRATVMVVEVGLLDRLQRQRTELATVMDLVQTDLVRALNLTLLLHGLNTGTGLRLGDTGSTGHLALKPDTLGFGSVELDVLTVPHGALLVAEHVGFAQFEQFTRLTLRDNDDEADRAASELGINISSRFETASIDEI